MASSTLGSINFGRLGSRLSAACAASADATSQPGVRSGILVVLDLHGVLVERIKRAEKRRVDFATKKRNPWRFNYRHATWLRPHLRAFLDMVSARHDVAVWSSAQSRTILQLLDNVSGHFDMQPPFKERLRFIWDRPRCRADVERGGHATLKYLPDLWDDVDCAGHYSCKNTLLLDDSSTKFRDFPDSGVLVPEYNADKLQEFYNSDDTLLWVLLYIEYLLEESYKMNDAAGGFDFSASRANCLSLEDFTLAGKLEARRLVTNRKQRKRLKSLAYVFLGDNAGSSVLSSELASANVNGEERAASVRQGESSSSRQEIDMAALSIQDV